MESNKHCPGCDTEKSITLFGIATRRSDGRNAYCLECMRRKRREHYEHNKPAHAERNRRNRESIRDFVLELKSHPCVDCGESYPDEPWLMEFDHRDPSEKRYQISQLANSGMRDKLIEELKKCDVVCLICHKRRTAKVFGWVDNRYRLPL